VAEEKKCGACGVDIQSNAPFGHCPKCLLELGFGAMPDDAAEQSEDSFWKNCMGTQNVFQNRMQYRVFTTGTDRNWMHEKNECSNCREMKTHCLAKGRYGGDP
jgi:hypothetical protein